MKEYVKVKEAVDILVKLLERSSEHMWTEKDVTQAAYYNGRAVTCAEILSELYRIAAERSNDE